MITHLKHFLSSVGLHIERQSTHINHLHAITELRDAQSSLFRILERANTLVRLKYGLVDAATGTYFPVLGTLFPDRYTGGGFFVALTKLMVTILECQQRKIVVRSIDNTLSMDLYKDADCTNNWSSFYRPCDDRRAEEFILRSRPREIKIIDILASRASHGDYQYVLNALGAEWITEFLDVYCRPSLASEQLSHQYDVLTGIQESKPLAIYYRGTDKYREIEPVALADIYCLVDQICSRQSSTKILIQTDQQQVRDDVLQRYGRRCLFIADLPVTKGNVGLHHLSNHARSREYSGQQLVAMAEVIGSCPTLVTTTSNVGFFLAMKVFSQGGNVHQILGSVC